MDLTASTAYTLALSDRAVKIATELAPAIGAYWDALHTKAGDDPGSDSDHPDFGAACRQIGGALRSLQAQLLVAVISAEIEPSRKLRRLVRRIQQRLGFWIARLRGLLMLSRYEAEADSLECKRTYFRSIRGLPPREETTVEGRSFRAFRALRAMQGLDPRALFEAQMGMLAMAGFPDRPFSPQQQRRKRRRRRRSNPGAPTASSRGADREED